MITRKIAIAAVLLASVTPWTLSAQPAGPVFPAANVRMEIINIPSAAPGKMIAAPGGGFVTTPAILYNPAAGENVYGPAILIVDQGPGSNPIRNGEPGRFMAERLAAQGYTVLTIYSHLVRGYSLIPFEETAKQIDTALLYLEERGHDDLVLAGSGYGAIAAANYLATMDDEPMDAPGTKRVKAAFFLSPLTELRKYPRAQLDTPAYAAKAEAAEKSVAAGTGTYPEGNIVEVGGTTSAKVDPWMAAGPYNGPAEQFVSYWSPRAAARNEAALAALKRPTLVIGAGRDPIYSEAHLKTIAPSAPIQTINYPESEASFAGYEDKAAGEVHAFLKAQGLGVRPRIKLSVIDATVDDGRSLPAVVYTPEAGSDLDKPVYVFLHGRTGDTVQSSAHWAGWRLAQAGYTVIAPQFRISGAAGFASSNMTEQAADMGKWIDAIARLGHKRLILVGHSNGGIYSSIYMSKTHDPRVVGIVFMAPTVNERERNIALQGRKAVDAKLAAAKAAIARGDGMNYMIGFTNAQTYWDLNNPKTLGTHTDRIKEYSVPTLSIVGRNDGLFQNNDFIDRFVAAQKPGLAKVVWLEGGSHGMRESKSHVVAAIAEWTKATFGK